MRSYGATDYSYDPEAAYDYTQSSVVYSEPTNLTIIIETTVTKEPESSLDHIPCSKCDNEVLLNDEFKAEDNNYYCATCWEQWTNENVLAPAGLIANAV